MGTIFIQNVHLLSLETQDKLAKYITYGFYQRLKSEHNSASKARIICSSTQNIQTLATNGSFSNDLCEALKANALQLPSLVTLAAHELCALADGFAEQALKSQTFKNILQLSSKDKEKILDQKPASIKELKDKVYQMLMQKSAKHQIPVAQQFDAAYNFNDPELMQAIRLGKKALQDPNIMQLLWEKFGNQTKIAMVLGVNKSSVNRRFKEFDFIEN
jgi:DNA-binding NtrC family response regulator